MMRTHTRTHVRARTHTHTRARFLTFSGPQCVNNPARNRPFFLVFGLYDGVGEKVLGIGG